MPKCPIWGFNVCVLKTEPVSDKWVSDFNSLSVVGCLLMSALSRHCYAGHTGSLHDRTRLEIQASFCFHDLSMPAIWLLHSWSQITADYYPNGYRRRHANIRPYVSAVNEYSTIYDISLSLIESFHHWRKHNLLSPSEEEVTRNQTIHESKDQQLTSVSDNLTWAG